MATKPRPAIELAKNLSLDESAATETLEVLARKGRGKTFLASKIVEGLYGLNCPTTIIDPAGNWWGLTLAANGRDAGLPFVVLGGERVIWSCHQSRGIGRSELSSGSVASIWRTLRRTRSG